MRLLILFALIFISLILQISIMGYFSIGGVKPDLVIVWVILDAFIRGKNEGALVGFLSGLFIDILDGAYLGLYALSYMACGYMVGSLKDKLYKDSSIIIMFLVWLSVMFTQSLQYVILCFAGEIMPVGLSLSKVICSTAIYTAVLVPFVYQRFNHSNKEGLMKIR